MGTEPKLMGLPLLPTHHYLPTEAGGRIRLRAENGFPGLAELICQRRDFLVSGSWCTSKRKGINLRIKLIHYWSSTGHKKYDLFIKEFS